METNETVKVRDVIRGDRFAEEQIEQVRELLVSVQASETRQELSALQAEAKGSSDEDLLVRAGVGAFLLGQHELAGFFLESVKKQPTGLYYKALALLSLERFADAADAFETAAKGGYDEIECTLQRAGCTRQLGDVDEAEQMIRAIASQAAKRAEYSFQMGCIFADRGDSMGAIEYFERAVDMDHYHSRALFRLAAENALHGNDDDAIRYYEQSLSRPPFFLGALINLGLLYEDQENYPAAAYCFRKVLSYDPNHSRARLYLKDVEATSDQYYDEESARRDARMEQLLARPINDFELSVRARNCLDSMGLFTLGDLTSITEQELLNGKNFGETSLTELRELMTQHGLSIGQNLHKPEAPEPLFQNMNLSPEEQAVMNKPIADLELSVRSRKCMARLGITTVGELTRKSADDLLSSRNFGVTSLNELRAKLADLGLALRNE